MLKMRMRRLISVLSALALLLPTVSGAVSPAAFGFSPAVLAQMARYGANPAQVRSLLDGMESYVAQQARRYNIRVDSLRGSLTQKIIRVPANQRTLENAYAQVESSGKQIVALNSENAALKAQLATLTDAKLRTPARAALAEAQRAIDEGRLEDADARLAALEPLRLSEAVGANAAWIAVVEMRANVAKLSGDYRRQGEIAEEADRQLTRRENAQHWRLKMIKADAAYQMGSLGQMYSLGGGNKSLDEAIRIYQNEALPLVQRIERPNDWAKTQYELGRAFLFRGGFELDRTRLDKAVAAFNFALTVQVLQPSLLDWADTQNDLSLALGGIGARENGTKKTSQFDLALKAADAALGVYSQANDGIKWRMAQNNKALVLESLGEAATGTARLEQAAVAFRLALEKMSQTAEPQIWARTNMGWAEAEVMIAERTRNLALLEAARKRLYASTRIAVRSENQLLIAYGDNIIRRIEEIRAGLQAQPQK